jgi:hypothetical protein
MFQPSMDSNALNPLHDFFATLGGGAAALLGLLFVAVSINVKAIVQHDDTRELARHTFVSFVGVLLYALFVLLPQPVQQLGVEIAITSAALIFFTGPRFVQSFFRGESKLSRGKQIRRFGLALLLQLGALAIGADMVRGDTGAAPWLVAVVLVLLVAGARNSWEILVEMGSP